MLHQIKTPQFYTNFQNLISLEMQPSISKMEFENVNQYYSVGKSFKKSQKVLEFYTNLSL